ncbi:hypothetical protein [Streptomyces cadmiisoli]|uniref:hypothetical protein n=1 Tax=Streptomyces cadmiisoli TaxID=2184053 RepID=UPI0036577EE8
MSLTLITAVARPLSVEEQLVADWMAAREDRDRARMQALRSFARAIDPGLLDELDGFNYPAAA